MLAVSRRFNENGYIEDVEVNFIVWEIHGRNDYSFNNTMKKVCVVPCLNLYINYLRKIEPATRG